MRRGDLEAMTRSIVHRGPDDEGYFIAGPLGLGFRRLSIIDLAGGHQPMSDQEESVWVVFNGEIYNFPELKRELQSHGHIFRTNSDTEVIIHGYRQWGDEVLNRLNGMFGLAIWDVREKRLVVARDPFGIKLIYYRIDEGSLYFGSEVRPTLRHYFRENGDRYYVAESLPPIPLHALALHHIQGRTQTRTWHQTDGSEWCLRSESLVQIQARAIQTGQISSRSCGRVAVPL